MMELLEYGYPMESGPGPSPLEGRSGVPPFWIYMKRKEKKLWLVKSAIGQHLLLPLLILLLLFLLLILQLPLLLLLLLLFMLLILLLLVVLITAATTITTAAITITTNTAPAVITKRVHKKRRYKEIFLKIQSNEKVKPEGFFFFFFRLFK